jgi:hypothetical protein
VIGWPQSLVEDLEAGRVVLFIGSGVSRNSIGKDGKTRPKTWRDFLESAAKRARLEARVTPYLDRRDYLTALDIIRHSMPHDDYARLLRDEYQTPAYEPSDIHDALYRLNCRIVLTPNFDKIYDVYAGQKSRGTIDVKEYHCPHLAEFIRGDRRIIIKTHGSVDTVIKMIFGRRDYAKARVEHSLFYDVLRALVLTHTFLFVGCGTDDPDVRQVLEDIRFGAVGSRTHFFVSARGSLDGDIQSVLGDTMNLRVLEYDYEADSNDHADLTASLLDLADQVE